MDVREGHKTHSFHIKGHYGLLKLKRKTPTKEENWKIKARVLKQPAIEEENYYINIIFDYSTYNRVKLFPFYPYQYVIYY